MFPEGEAIDLFYKTAPLNDIGKAGGPDAVLLKPERLSDEEFFIMKKQTFYGEEASARAEGQVRSL